jgi:hypothetical protein
MPTARVRKPRATRTRSDVESGFEDLQARTENATELDPQAAKLATEHAEATRASVKGLSIDSIVAKGASLGLDIQRTLSGLTEQCVGKATELKTLQDAVELEKGELERLYDLDLASASIELLIQNHETKKAELQKEIEIAHDAWTVEHSTHQRACRERDAGLVDQRKKEQAEYDYKTHTERSRTEDAFAEKVRLQERAHADREAVFEKGLSERKALIAKEEAEITALKARVAGIDEEIRKAISKEVAFAESRMKKDHEHEKALLLASHTSALALAHQHIASLEVSNKALGDTALRLSSQLDAAKEQVATIATKAIEGASGQAALSKVMELQQNGSNQARSGSKS